jgi:hypothetical protein
MLTFLFHNLNRFDLALGRLSGIRARLNPVMKAGWN